MIRNVLTHIGGIGLYGVVSICLFVLVFCGIFLRACLLKRRDLDVLSRLPLQDGTQAVPGAPDDAAHPHTSTTERHDPAP